MLNGYRVIDADSHVMEPDDLFDRYLDPAFKQYAPKTRRIATDWPYFADMDVLGHKWPATLNWQDIHYLDDGRTSWTRTRSSSRSSGAPLPTSSTWTTPGSTRWSCTRR